MQFIRSGKDSGQSDETVISKYRETRDPYYIGLLFDRYCHLVFAVGMKYLKNEEDSKDAVIRIFEKLPKDLLTYSIHNFASWLHTVTKNDCLRFLSRNKNQYENMEALADWTEQEEETFTGQLLPFLETAILQLNKEQRICIDYFYLQNMSYREVSEKTGYDMHQVKSHIQNGKRNLKIILQKSANDK